MKDKTSTIIGFLASIFFGIVVFSIGLGSAFPSINLIAKPFVCPNGQMTFDKNVSQPMPGETYTTINWYCTDESSGENTELEYSSIFSFAGIIYGIVLCFPLFLLARFFFKRWDDSLKKKYDAERQLRKKRKA
jgi:hypothetical protein